MREQNDFISFTRDEDDMTIIAFVIDDDDEETFLNTKSYQDFMYFLVADDYIETNDEMSVAEISAWLMSNKDFIVKNFIAICERKFQEFQLAPNVNDLVSDENLYLAIAQEVFDDYHNVAEAEDTLEALDDTPELCQEDEVEDFEEVIEERIPAFLPGYFAPLTPEEEAKAAEITDLEMGAHDWEGERFNQVQDMLDPEKEKQRVKDAVEAQKLSGSKAEIEPAMNTKWHKQMRSWYSQFFSYPEFEEKHTYNTGEEEDIDDELPSSLENDIGAALGYDDDEEDDDLDELEEEYLCNI